MDLLKERLRKFQIELSERQISQFQTYYKLLMEWNSFMNLTAITDISEVIDKHFTDSISLVKAVPDLADRDCILTVLRHSRWISVRWLIPSRFAA